MPSWRRVVVQAGLHRGQGVGPSIPGPAPGVLFPPGKYVGVVHPLEHLPTELQVRQQPLPVQDGERLVVFRVGVAVVLVKGLNDVLQDGLHPGAPVLPHSLRHPHHRVGGAVPVGKDPRVQQVDPRRLRIVSQVDEVDPVDDLLWDLLQQVVDQVGVGVDDYNGVVVPPRCLLPHLVQDDVLHQRGFAHAGAGHVEVVAARGVIGEVDLAGAASHRVPHVGAAGGGLGRRVQNPGPGAGHRG